MLASGSPLADALTRLEPLIRRLEAGEPVSEPLQALLERLLWMTGLPAPQDFSEVREVLEDLRREPCTVRLDRLRQALEALPAQGPTASAQANALLDLASSAVQGERVEEYSVQVLALDSEIAALATRFAALELPGPSERFCEAAREGAAQLQNARAGLAGLDEAVAAGSQADLLTCSQDLVFALNRAAQLHRELERLLALEGRTPCIRCGCSNPSERTLCEHCGAILPAAAIHPEGMLDFRVGEEGASGQTRMTENLARLFEACDQFYAGTLDPQAFLQVVSWLEGLLEQARRLGLGDGVEEFEGGLLLLRQAGELEDRALLDAGRRRVWEGAGRLQASG